MAEIAAIRVLNVLRHYEKKVDKYGVETLENHVKFSIDGGIIDVIYDPAVVDIPLGWSGRALVELLPRSITQKSKKGEDYDVTFLNPWRLRSFEKGYKHPDLEDILSSRK